MKNLLWILPVMYICIWSGCGESDNIPQDLKEQFPKSISLIVTNPADFARNDVSIQLSITELHKKDETFNPQAFLVWSGTNEIPSQLADSDADGEFDAIILNLDMTTMEKKHLTVRYHPRNMSTRTYQKRTQAELSHKFGGKFVDRKYVNGQFQNVDYLRVPPEHTDHSEFIRYEGPGWESDKIGYRFYLDWRNAIDIFGKKTTDMVLHNVGLDGFESYHQPADWGMDILKVGESLGVGSIAMWQKDRAKRVAETDSIDCRIIADGPVCSQIRTRYFGWTVGSAKYNLISDLSINAGSRLTKHDLQLDPVAENLCTGLAKHESTEFMQSDPAADGWAYIALYGEQSLAGDNLGTAVLYETQQLIDVTEDELNHVVVLRPDSHQLIYYFVAAWEQEPDGVKTQQQFEDYLLKTVEELNMPVKIEY